jgi:tetratricopeptide (TPR) repeat protein
LRGRRFRFTVAGEVDPMKPLLLVALVAALAGCPNEEKNSSIEHLNKCVEAHSRKQFDTAINECEKAVSSWKGNHSAWYTMGGAHAARNNWKDAVDAFEKAAGAKDSEPMYHQWLGIAMYNREIQTAVTSLAERRGKKPEEVAGEVNLATLNFEGAIQQLQTAIKQNNQLWNSHYHLGRIYRDTDQPGPAATELTQAIMQNPFEWTPYVALAELYRQWDYPDQAIQVATIGTKYIPGKTEQSNVWYEVGMGYHDKKQEDQAIDAFTKALDAKPDNYAAKFQLGQAYFKKNDCANAKKHLDVYSKSGPGKAQLEKQQANRMVMECAAKQI